MPPDTSDVFTAIERRRGEFLDDLQQYLRIPSISTDPAYRSEIARCAGEVPTLTAVGGNRQVACHLVAGAATRDAA